MTPYTNQDYSATAQHKPLVTIVGVLGKQGLSTARTLLASGKYRVRGITRRLDSPAALELSGLGAELVSIPLDLGHKASFVNAFKGSDSVFLMTPNIAPPATHEFPLGKELADAVVEAGVPHVIFSSLENVEELTHGQKFAPHFTDKAKVEAYIRELPIKSSFLIMAFFYTNLLEFYTPVVKDDILVFPIYLPQHFRAPFVDPLTATGPAVLEILGHPDLYAGKSLPVIGDMITPQEMVDTFVKVTGKKAVYTSAYSREELLANFPGFAANELLVQELTGMVAYAVEYGYYRADRDLSWSRKVNPSILNWEQFLVNTGWKGEQLAY